MTHLTSESKVSKRGKPSWTTSHLHVRILMILLKLIIVGVWIELVSDRSGQHLPKYDMCH